jgi:hypothetical protein
MLKMLKVMMTLSQCSAKDITSRAGEAEIVPSILPWARGRVGGESEGDDDASRVTMLRMLKMMTLSTCSDEDVAGIVGPEARTLDATMSVEQYTGVQLRTNGWRELP